MNAARMKAACAKRILSARKKFGRYNEESKEEIKTAAFRKDPMVERLARAFEKFTIIQPECSVMEPEEVAAFTDVFGKMTDRPAFFTNFTALGIPRWSAKDVEKFSLAIPEYRLEHAGKNAGIAGQFTYRERMGLFLNELIQRSREKDYRIHVDHHESESLGYVGFQNTKNILVLGALGSNVCERMRSGTVTIEGDVDSNSAFVMKGGQLIIRGNASNNLGLLMENGKVILEGNAGYEVGDGMTGGEIHVMGEIEGIGEVEGGRIYHKGKLIVDVEPDY